MLFFLLVQGGLYRPFKHYFVKLIIWDT